MATLRYLKQAEADYDHIANYTVKTWSQDQAVRYVLDMHEFCSKLAENPRLRAD